MKKYLLFLLFICLASLAVAQTFPKNPNKTDSQGLRQGAWTIMYNKDWKETKSKGKIAFYRLITYKDDKPVGKVIDYYLSGKVQMEATFLADRPKEVLDGVATWYREDGTRQNEKIFKDGEIKSEKIFNLNGNELQFNTKKEDTEDLLNSNLDNMQTKTWKELSDIANSYYNKQDYKRAIVYYQKALPLAEKEFGKEDRKYALTANDLAICYKQQGKYKEAELLYVEVKNIETKLLGKENTDYAISCKNLADLYHSQGKYDKATPLYVEAKNIRLKILGKENIDYATSCSNLAKCYEFQGKYDEAKPLYIEAKHIFNKILGTKHTTYAISCNDLGLLYRKQDLYVEAEPFFLEAKNIYEKILGTRDDNYATICDNLAVLYVSQGKYVEAEALHIEAKGIREKVLGKIHEQYAISCNNLAQLYKNQGKYVKAKPLLIEAKSIREKVLGKEHPDYAVSCSNLAGLYYKQGLYEEAKHLFIEAKGIREKVLGKEHPDYATSCNNLAVLFCEQGLYPDAMPLYIEARSIKEKTLGITHIDYAISCNNLALLYENEGKYDKADVLYIEGNQAFLAQIDKNFATLSEKEKATFYKTFSFNLEIFNSFVVKRYNQNPSITIEAYNNTLATKALLFQASNKMRERVSTSNDEQLKALFQAWKDKKEYLNKVYSMPIADRQKQGIEVGKLETEANELEKQLSMKSEIFAKTVDKKRYTWKDVQQKLKKEEVAIEIIRFQVCNKKWTDTIQYMALVVTPESKYPEMILLENGNELEGKYAKNYQNCIKAKSNDKYSYLQYWAKIGAKLQGVKKVYLSVDGIYNSLSFNTLKNPATGKFLGEEIEIQLVSNTKDIALPATSPLTPERGTKAVLIGFPDYNNKNKPTKSLLTPEGGIKMDSTQRFFDGNDITELLGTKTEVENLQNTFQKANINAQIYTEQQASEALIKKLDNPKILHIATHGFFLKDVENTQDIERGMMGMDNRKVAENPLLRSGLLFANAKNALQEGGDGVLTAYEAMNLNLDNTDLVVLSACETGLGEIKNGEGVYGLQRAFQQAGAKTILMSLWTVSDDATQELMTLFYENLITKKQSKRLAFQNAQNALKKKFPDPYFWGAFVMVGE